MTLLSPLWLLAVPVLLFVGWQHRHTLANDAWHKLISPAMLYRLRPRPGMQHSRFPLSVLAAGIALCLTNPVTKSHGQHEAFAGSEIWWALVDVSPSMGSEDISPSRLNAAQRALHRIRQAADSRALGMIVFAGDAFLAHPPTHDRQSFSDFTRSLETELIPLSGSRPDQALALARRFLSDQPGQRARLWLLTDGGGVTEQTMTQARHLRTAGHRLDIIQTALATSTQPEPVDVQRLESLADLGAGQRWPVDALGRFSDSPFAKNNLASAEQSFSLTLNGYSQWSQWLVLCLLPLCWRLLRREHA